MRLNDVHTAKIVTYIKIWTIINVEVEWNFFQPERLTEEFKWQQTI